MTLIDAVRICFSKYADFSGRAVRSEFWYWTLFGFAVGLVGQVISGAIPVVLLLLLLFDVAVFIPGLAVSARRLHDTGHSGWNLLWVLTLIGAFYLLYLYVQPTQPGANAYGEPASAFAN